MDRLLEMEAFAAVVDQGGFTQAARKLGLSKSAISKNVASLETRLGARLLDRTTRRVSPTDLGLLYYDRVCGVINEAAEADSLVASMHRSVSGILRVSISSDFGTSTLAGVIGDFIEAYPQVTVSLILHNHYDDVPSEDFDMSIRSGDLDDPSLVARKLTEIRKRMVASPEYIARYGRPSRIEDLPSHKLLHYSERAKGSFWQLRAPSGEMRQVRSSGWLSVNDNPSLVRAAVRGLGIAFLPTFLLREEMADRALVDAMPSLPPQTEAIYAVYPPGRYPQPKVRAFIDFLTQAMATREANSDAA